MGDLERKQDHRDGDDRAADGPKSSTDPDDFEEEGRGRPIPKTYDDEEESNDRNRSKDEMLCEDTDDRRKGSKTFKLGHGVKRSLSPADIRQKGRVEQEDFDRDWLDNRRYERSSWRDYDRDRDRDRFSEREADYQRDWELKHRDNVLYDGDFSKDLARDRDDSARWKRRQQEQENDVEYNFERDGWEVPKREKEKPERSHKDVDEWKDKNQMDVLKTSHESGFVSELANRAGGNDNASMDLIARDRSVDSSLRRGDGDFHGNSGEADWAADDKHWHGDNDYQDRNYFDAENLPGPDQNFGRSSSRVGDGAASIGGQSGRVRGPKGSPRQRGRGGGEGRLPFVNSQTMGISTRGGQQSGKGGRGRGGGKGGRSGARDAQRGSGIPPLMGPGPGPGIVPHFTNHMGPPGSLPVMPGHGPGLGPGGFPLPPFRTPVAWGGAQGSGDMCMHPGPAPPVHSAVPAPRFGPNMGPGPGHNPFFTPPRGVLNVIPASAPHGGPSFGGRPLLPEKVPMNRVPPRVNAPAGLAPSRGEQNDYSQHFVDTGLRPQNFIRDVDLGDRFEEYPKLKELITRKDKLVTDHACPPMYMQMDLRTTELSSEVFGTKFDVILIDPPWEEYVRRAPGVGDSMEWWSFEEIQTLRIEALADTPSFIFLWVGDAEGLELGRLCLKKWGFRRCEDICWVKTNKENPTPALRHDASTLLQHSKEHCLMGIKGTVRRSNDAHIIHANIDTDVIISEEPAYGSTEKPEELYHVVEHFALGKRRLELFGEDHNIRAGWITVGKNLTSSNFNAQTYCKFVGDTDGKVWQGGRGNPPVDAAHLVGTTPEIEALRPKSPPPRAQQQQQSQAANSVSQPSAAHSNSKKAQNVSQGTSPQNLQATSAGASGQVANSSSVIVISTSSPSPRQSPSSMGKGGSANKQMRQSPLHASCCEPEKAGSDNEKGEGLDTSQDTGA